MLFIMLVSAGSHSGPLDYSSVPNSLEATQSHKSEGCRVASTHSFLWSPAKEQNKIALPRATEETITDLQGVQT